MNREQERVSIACKASDDKKALDIKVIDIREVSVIADYFVITSGSNLNQVQAIVDNVEEQLGSCLLYTSYGKYHIVAELPEYMRGYGNRAKYRYTASICQLWTYVTDQSLYRNGYGIECRTSEQRIQ